MSVCHQFCMKYNLSWIVFKITRGEDIGLFITLVPKFLLLRFLFVSLTTFETFIEFLLIGSLRD